MQFARRPHAREVPRKAGGLATSLPRQQRNTVLVLLVVAWRLRNERRHFSGGLTKCRAEARKASCVPAKRPPLFAGSRCGCHTCTSFPASKSTLHIPTIASLTLSPEVAKAASVRNVVLWFQLRSDHRSGLFMVRTQKLRGSTLPNLFFFRQLSLRGQRLIQTIIWNKFPWNQSHVTCWNI